MVVHFQKSDFRKSQFVNVLDCPLARAIRRELKLSPEDIVLVNISTVFVQAKSINTVYNIFSCELNNKIIGVDFSISEYQKVKKAFRSFKSFFTKPIATVSLDTI